MFRFSPWVFGLRFRVCSATFFGLQALLLGFWAHASDPAFLVEGVLTRVFSFDRYTKTPKTKLISGHVWASMSQL